MEKNNLMVVCYGYYDSSKNLVPCGKIKVDETIWKSENDIKREFPELYSLYLIKKDNEILSHSLCPDCKNKSMKILDLDDLKNSKNNLENKTDECWPLEADSRIFM